jgi:hypothetical protein
MSRSQFRTAWCSTSQVDLEVDTAAHLELGDLDGLFGTWLAASGYVPSDQPCFEAWIGGGVSLYVPAQDEP